MNYKKVTALILASVMMASAFVGCSGGGDEKTSKSEGSKTETNSSKEETLEDISFPLKETMEFTSFSGMDQEYALDECLAMQTAMENANIKISFDSVLGADLTEKRNLVLASGDYPDMFLKASLAMSDLNKYGSQGIFIPLEDLIREYAPNLTAKLDEMDAWEYITSSDGHIYSLPEISRPNGSNPAYWVNKKWMDSLGLQEPKSFDELYEVLKAFKEEDANGNGDPSDEIPITFTDVVKPELLLQYADYGYDTATRTAVIDGELTYLPTSEEWKEFIAYITKLYQEGLMDKNSFTQKHEQQAAIGQSGDVNNTGVTPGTLAITDACEHPEVIVAWADQFYSEEGGVLAWLGVEGETYKINEAGDWEWIVGGEYGEDIATVRSKATIQGAQNHPSIQPDFWFDKMSVEVDPDEVYLNEQRAKAAELGAIPLPMMQYSDEDMKTISTLKTDLDAYIDQYLAQVATGELDLEESWEEYVATANAMGAEELTSIYQKTYSEAIK
ncbi:MAG: extracellular solute-binding protein [Firmicutes bacterium]|nr:extracellular solute-binding protein [Bacillota bacterium]